METRGFKIVEFEKWCHKCKHADMRETEEPCCDCLYEAVNVDFRRPVYFEEAEDGKQGTKVRKGL